MVEITKKLLNHLKLLLPTQLYKRPLDGAGERVDIYYNGNVDFEKLNTYERSHLRRYEFARDVIPVGAACGDFACGTGYGTVMLAEKTQKVIGADIDLHVIETIRKRYGEVHNIEFIHCDLLSLTYRATFDAIVSFETLEHFTEENIAKLLHIFHNGLKPSGQLIFSVPYLQEQTETAIAMGFHRTFHIDEPKLECWMSAAGFRPECYMYQDYETHMITRTPKKRDFIICIARKLT